MPITASPLRYPGGKSRIRPLISEILKINRMEKMPYSEPYAGGCGLALDLLFGGYVSEIHVNDVDRSIWSFWHCVLERTEEFVSLIEATPVTVEEWHKQKEIHANADQENELALGFATFFLNRTNRSGIIKRAGMIGGFSQSGNYKMDCRFNKENLVRRIRRIEKYKDRITLYNLDANEFLTDVSDSMSEKTFFYIDPPYYNKGSSLYTSFYERKDHKHVSDLIKDIKHPWIVTYDNAEEIKSLYSTQRQFTFDINYSVQTKRVGSELLIASKGVRIPSSMRERQVNKPKRIAA